MIRNFSTLGIALLLLMLGSANAQDDPYSENLVREAMTTPVITSFMEKAVSRLGDRAAIAIIRTLGDKGLQDAAQANTVLFVLQTAFSVPQNITEPTDRDPKATLFMLRWMSELPIGRELANGIDKTRHNILSATSGEQGSAK